MKMLWNRLIVLGFVAVSVGLSAVIVEASLSLEAKVTKEVTFDITIGSDEVGKLVIGLFGEAAPRTVDNFAQLSSNENGYGYKGTPFHRIIDDFVIQGASPDLAQHLTLNLAHGACTSARSLRLG